jgi:PII-like signaling protein
MEGAGERPMVIEIVDAPDRVREFAKQAALWLGEKNGLITEGIVEVLHAEAAAPTAVEEKRMDRNSTGGDHVLLRIFIKETDRTGDRPHFEEILGRGRALGIAGATVLKGVLGYGASRTVHPGHLLSPDVPMVIEVVDRPEKIRELLEQIKPMIQGALVTEEKVQVLHSAGRPQS